MYKYLTKDDIKNAILDLDLVKGKMSDKAKIKLLYALSNNIENNYREFTIRKKNGGARILAEPTDTLKSIQRRLLLNILYEFKPSEYVTSYTKGKSLKDNAYPHVGKEKVLKLDIEGFFDNISFGLVYSKVFGLDRFPREVGVLLTSLVCYYGALPQGAPTSAYISNLVLSEFDSAIGTWAEEHGIKYTRYSDDMTFSGQMDAGEVIRLVRKELKKYGLTLNDEKTRVISSSTRQMVTGVCVNKKLQTSIIYRKKIRQEVYYITRFGVESHLEKIGTNDVLRYLRSLYGRILFVLNVDPENVEFLKYKTFVRSLIDEKR